MCKINKFLLVCVAVLFAYFLYSEWMFEYVLPQVLPEESIPEDYFCHDALPYVVRCCEHIDGSGYCALFVD